jgi:hypothetical protein
MNIIVLYIQKSCEVLNERGVVLVHQTSNEIRPWGIAWNHSSNAHDTIDTGLIEVCLISDHTENTVRCTLQVSSSIAISNTDGVIDKVSTEDIDLPVLVIVQVIFSSIWIL